jgi:hypothetical protein
MELEFEKMILIPVLSRGDDSQVGDRKGAQRVSAVILGMVVGMVLGMVLGMRSQRKTQGAQGQCRDEEEGRSREAQAKIKTEKHRRRVLAAFGTNGNSYSLINV